MHFKALWGKLNGTLLGGASVLVLGSLAGQVLAVVATPLLTRLYGPEDFGILAVYVSAISIASAFSSLRYELAILLPRTDAAALTLALLGSFSVFVLAIISGIVISIIEVSAGHLGLRSIYLPYIWLLPFGILLSGLRNILTYWALRKKGFIRIALTQVQLSGVMVLIQLLAGMAQKGPGGLIVGHIAGFLAGFVSLFTLLKRTGWKQLAKIRRSLTAAVAHKYRDFPFYSTWSQMTNVIGLELPTILLASLFSPAVAGYYMLAHRVGSSPVTMISDGVGKVFMTIVADSRRKGTMNEVVTVVFTSLMRIGWFPFLVIGIFAPEVFSFVFGRTWGQSGHYLQLLAPWISCVFVFVPILTLFSVLEKQKMALGFQVTLLVIRVISLGIGVLFKSVPVALICYAWSGVVVYAFYSGWIMRQASVPYLKMAKELLREALFLVPLGAALILFKKYFLEYGVSRGIEIWSVLAVLSIVFLVIHVVRAVSAIKSLRVLTFSRAGES